jgi:hydroxymethylbilane synthase
VSRTIRVVTRGSALALAQTSQLVRLLEEANEGMRFEMVTISTTGDRVTDRPLSQFRGMGVFVKELRKAILSDDADIAIHSLKDVPVEPAEGLALAGFPKRIAPWDLLLSRDGRKLEELEAGAVIGTSSPRRLVQLKARRPDLVFKDLRGNLDTRLRKLEDGLYDAIIAAAAGMIRLGKNGHSGTILSPEICLPAAGQGSLAIECRASDRQAMKVASTMDDPVSRIEVEAERDLLREIGGGCQTPMGVYAELKNGRLVISAAIGDEESLKILRETFVVPLAELPGAGKRFADTLRDRCASEGIGLA